MADEIIRLDYSAEDIGDNIDEVREARGTYDTLDGRLDNIEGGGPSPSNPIASNCVSPMTGYSKSSSSTPGNISTNDTLNAAIGKLEKRTELNENNISLNARNGVSNYINTPDVTISASGYVLNTLGCNIPKGDYYLKYTSTQTISGNIQITLKDSNNTTVYDTTTTSTSGGNLIPITLSTEAKTITIYSVRAGTYSNLQIISKSLYDAGLTDYQPYAMSNAELTEEVRQIGGIKLVAHTSANSLTSLSYDTNINDFAIDGTNTDKSSGVYMIVCNNWSTTPAPYIGLLTFSGATTNHFVKTDVVTGFTPTITITENVANATITISGAAKISIYALR